ncbi:MAG: pectinesterase family protein [Bacteroides sp.]|nr:pectinesterase family protein [Bacteroides sp.]
MKKAFSSFLWTIAGGLLPIGLSAQTTIASWNFEGGYDKAEDATAKVMKLTPNGGEFAEIGATWFNNLAPSMLPDECAGEKTAYALTAKSNGRYWQLCNGYNNHVLRIENAEANSISDYSNPEQHNVYYEIKFPTTGYKNISVEYAVAYGGNAEAAIETVVSTDGGTTWFDAGSATTAGTWWTYDKKNVNISANNKPEVLVRLIAGNGFASNWNLDYITVTGEDAAAASKVDQKGLTFSWDLQKGTDSPTKATPSVDGLFSVAEFSHGTNLTITGVRNDGDAVSRTQFQPIDGGNSVNNDENAIIFTLKPKKGLKFKPTGVAFKASRVGTNGGNFDVEIAAGATSEMLAEGFTPQLTKEAPYFSKCNYNVTAIEATEEPVTVKIYIKGLANNKQYAFADVVITGDVNGEMEAVPAYSLSVSLGTPGAGNIICNPAGAEFDEGTKISVSATENFGYHFKEWVDAEGKTVTDANPYVFVLKANTVLKAVYDKKNVYALNLTLGGGANTNLVQVMPEGNLVDGIHYYEEGTDVKLTALNNRILTFTNWDDNSTSPERDIVMNGEQNITASFSSADFIVGWDLYNDQPASQRAADYKDETDNAGLLSLRNAAGNTTSWLTRGSKNGQENGKYAARIWKYLSEEWYYEISFSSKGYSNLKLSAAVGDDYNTYSVINAEYSIDGTNFTKFGTYNPPSRGWDSEEFDLPAEASDKDRVYIRFMPDRTSDKIGVESDYDGTSVAEIFVLADKDAANDEIAPKLVNSIPADKSKGASATGSIILNFDEKIKIGSGDATLDGEVLAPTISGKSVVYKYSGLKYATAYTFKVPAGAIVDRGGNKFEGVELTFTTMERVQPEARVFDAIVAADGSGNYKSVQEAIDAAPANRVKPWLIFVKNGNYKEHIDIPASKPFLHFIGQDRDKAVILDDRLCGGENAYGVGEGATVVIKSNDCFFENITLENSHGHEKQAGPQALALNTSCDRTIFNNVAMLSYQDTWITPSTSNYRAFVKNSLIEGAVDFIYNSGNIFLESDTLLINRKSGGYIVAPSHAADVEWGYVFNNCVITAPGVPSETDVWLGRPWHNSPKTVFLNTRAEVTIPASGWYETMGGLPVLWADWNTTDANGNLLDLSQRRDTYYKTVDGEKVYGTAKNFLTDEEAAQYTIKNVLSGKDNWQPEIKTEACDAPSVKIEGNTLSWEAVPYAICYIVEADGEVVAITTETSANVTSSDKVFTVRSVNEFGGLSPRAKVGAQSAIDSVNEDADMVIDAIFTIEGRQISNFRNGMNIVRYRNMSTGKTIVKKVIVR